MTLSYGPRLACIALACFFLVYLISAVAVALSVSRIVRAAQGFTSHTAARFVLFLKLMPLGFAVFSAVGLCVPSYLWFEPERVDEHVGLACLAMSLLGAMVLFFAVVRASVLAMRSLVFQRRCREFARERADLKAWVIESSQPFLALTGIVRPQIVISRRIVSALTQEELAVVLRHENAHRASFDNLKRLCLSLTPGFRKMDHAWVRFAEYAADEAAVAGDGHRAVALASALVSVARFGQDSFAAPVAISFVGDVSDLQARVDRLLAPRTTTCVSPGARPLLITGGCLIVATLNPVALRMVQGLIEYLIR